MCIDIAGGSGSSGDVELTYYVDPGDDVELDADDFWDLFDEESREDFEYLEFYSYDDFDDYGYFEAEDADGDWVQLYDSTLDDGYYYYNWYDTSSSYDYALDRMTFCADKNADEDTLEFPFTMLRRRQRRSGRHPLHRDRRGHRHQLQGGLRLPGGPGRRCDAGCRGLLRLFLR